MNEKEEKAIRISFPWKPEKGTLDIVAWNPSDHTMFPITSLVQELVKYTINNCPSELYQAWKILVLGTDEYVGKEALILHYANLHIEEAQWKTERERSGK